MDEESRLRAWLEFHAKLYRYVLPGISRACELALKGEPPPVWRESDRVGEIQGEYALGGVDGLLCDLFGSDWHKDIRREDVVKAMRKHLGV